jgi:hypothetical protein
MVHNRVHKGVLYGIRSQFGALASNGDANSPQFALQIDL